jgi:hypothetical protein
MVPVLSSLPHSDLQTAVSRRVAISPAEAGTAALLLFEMAELE